MCRWGKTLTEPLWRAHKKSGWRFWPPPLSIVAVFLPIGFMEGIIGKFFHEFGITIVAAVMISMFVSFTLDPMLSSIWHDPSIESHGKRQGPLTFYDKTIGRVTAWFDRSTDQLAEGYQKILAWSLVHKRKTVLLAHRYFCLELSCSCFALLGTEFVPKADFSETTAEFSRPPWAAPLRPPRPRRPTGAKPSSASCQKCATPSATINTGNALGKNNTSIYVRLVDRKDRNRNVDQMSGCAARTPQAKCPGITVTHVWPLLDSVGGNKQVEFSLQGPDQRELERLALLGVMEKVRDIPGLVDLDSSVKAQQADLDRRGSIA